MNNNPLLNNKTRVLAMYNVLLGSQLLKANWYSYRQSPCSLLSNEGLWVVFSFYHLMSKNTFTPLWNSYDYCKIFDSAPCCLTSSLIVFIEIFCKFSWRLKRPICFIRLSHRPITEIRGILGSILKHFRIYSTNDMRIFSTNSALL